jgi:SulP family sulfate permease
VGFTAGIGTIILASEIAPFLGLRLDGPEPTAIPPKLAALAGVLVVVAWGMLERDAVTTLLRASRSDALVTASVFGLTVLRDLTEAIVVGVALGALLFIKRVSEAVAVEPAHEERDLAMAADPDFVYRVKGAFFFAAVPFVVSSGARAMELLARKAERQGVRLVLTGLSESTEPVLRAHGVAQPGVLVYATIAEAVAALKQ